MQRRVWGSSQPVTGPDLTEVGVNAEVGTEQLALATGTGILSGLEVVPTPAPSASVIISGGVALLHDPAVGRPRLVTLAAQQTLSFSGKANGQYALVLSPVETGADNRTILPPPPGNPFYDAALQPYQLDTLRVWTATVSPQAMPYTPVGAQRVLATVNWSGNVITAGDLARVLDLPTPLMANGSVLPVKLSPGLAGPGLSRNDLTGQLGVRLDPASLVLGAQGEVGLRDGSVTDTKLGVRNVDQSRPLPAQPGDAAPLSQVLGWLGAQHRAVTGEASWNLAPATTLRELHANVARKTVAEQIGSNWTFTTSPAVPDPTQEGHAANRRWVLSQVGGAQSGAAGALSAHRTAAVLDHPDGSVTDAKLGPRTAVAAPGLPGGMTPSGTLQEIVGWYAAALSAHGGVAWNSPVPATLTSLHARTLALEGEIGTVPDGTITDAKIGPRTLTPSAPTGSTALLTPLLSGLAQRIGAVYGVGSWLDTPPTTLSELNGAVARRGRDEQITGSWTFARPASGTAPTAAEHLATKAYVDATANSLGSGIAGSLMTAHRTAAVLDHPDASVTGAKLSPTAISDRLGYVPLGPSGGTVTALTVSNGAGGLRINPGGGDSAFLALHARSATGTVRSGLVGYAGNDAHLRVTNELSGGSVILQPGAGGSVQTGAAFSAGALLSQGGVSASAGGDLVTLGGAERYELRLANANKALSVFSPGGDVQLGVVGHLSVSRTLTAGTLSASTLSAGELTLTSGDDDRQRLYVSAQGAVRTLIVESANDADDAIDLRSANVLINGQAIWHAGNLNPALYALKSDVTAAQLLQTLLTVDGAGSGLDADLLDGLDSSAFARATHTHTRAQITDFAHTHTIGELPVAAPGETSAAKLVRSDDPRLTPSGVVPAHTHTRAQIVDFAHTHAIGEISGLQAALDGKAAGTHSHTVAQIVGLQNALDGKSNVGHTHAWSEITGKPTTLEGYGITDGNVYDLSGNNPGRPPAGEAVLMFPVPRTVRLSATAPGVARVRVAATATTTFRVLQDGGEVGTITFAPGATTGAISLTGNLVLNPGAMLTVLAPATRDATLSDLAITFAGRV